MSTADRRPWGDTTPRAGGVWDDHSEACGDGAIRECLVSFIGAWDSLRYIPTMADYSEYQKKVIRRFYENRESGDEQRLAELVTNLYLSEGKKREKLWAQAEETMLRLKVPKKRVEHLIKTKDPSLIAEVVKELEAGTLKREAPPAKTD